MVYNAQNDWVWTLSTVRCSENLRAQRSGNWFCFRPRVRWELTSIKNAGRWTKSKNSVIPIFFFPDCFPLSFGIYPADAYLLRTSSVLPTLPKVNGYSA
jgi:hypothetical protein